MAETLSALDAGFLRLEGRNTSLHIASVAIFEGPAPTYGEFLALFVGKLPGLPRYRQRVRGTPLSLGPPVWADDPHFSLRYHVRNTALPSPGSETQLRDLVGRLMSQKLDRDRPLWESWLVEGLEGGRWGMINKLHHCMADGIAGNDLLAAVLDHTPDPQPADPVTDVWKPASEPGPIALLATALTSPTFTPSDVIRQVAGVAAHPRATLSAGVRLMRGMTGYARLVKPASPSSLSGPLGKARSWGWGRTTIGDVRTVRQELGGTVNDVVLTAIAGGFRELLLSRGEVPGGMVVRTLVPVSVRGAAEIGLTDNRISALVADLPVGVADPVERLHAMRAELDRLKESGEREVGVFFTELGELVPSVVVAAGETMAFRLPQWMISTVTTNVPGPRFPLYALGRRMLDLYPIVPIANQLRTGVAISTYEQAVIFGVTADRRSTPDIDVLIGGIEEGMRELLKAAQRHKAQKLHKAAQLLNAEQHHKPSTA